MVVILVSLLVARSFADRYLLILLIASLLILLMAILDIHLCHHLTNRAQALSALSCLHSLQAATCDVCEMPPRFKNRNISTHEFLILEMEAQIAGDLRRAILSEARGVMATRPLGMNGKHYWWIHFSELLLRRHYQRIRDGWSWRERNWENIARSWIRRTIEMRNNNQLLELIASMMENTFFRKRPDNWSQRPSIRCAVCVVEAIQSGRDSKWCTQNHAGGKLRIFPRTLTQLAGIRRGTVPH